MFKKSLAILASCSLAALTSTQTVALNLIDNTYVWDFLSDQAWPQGYQQATGKPDNLVWAREQYPADFFQRINNALPEASVNEAFLVDDEGANITLNDDAEVFITFIHEGAGYRNSFGYFTFDANNPPSSPDDINEVIIFPNLSYPHMANGHRISLGNFTAGTSIGFFIAANGFSYYHGVKPYAVPYYYSLKHLNPDPEGLKQHNVLLFDEDVNEIILGFEDLPRSYGDNDFNDAVFSIKSTPASAINTQTLVSMPDANDSDADGINDSEDEFPNDYRRASSLYYPSAEGWITLAYEDNWPELGDYDFNDLVIRERLQLTYNSTGGISGFILHGYIDARGANYHNGFALRLMGQAPSLIAQASLDLAGSTYQKVTEADQTDAVLILWNDSHQFTTTGEPGQCQHFNTVKQCSQFEPVPFSLDVSFSVPIASLNHSMFDFFIFRTNNRSREIHFADYPPTDLFDQSQFGRFADTSNSATGRYFRDQNNLPWALKVPQKWHYPREYIDILWAYPDYETWVESSGEQASNWFNTSDKSTHWYE